MNPKLTREEVEKIVASAYPKQPNLNGADLGGLSFFVSFIPPISVRPPGWAAGCKFFKGR
jgi:hypothetical protein